jgi:hypothetical protein
MLKLLGVVLDLLHLFVVFLPVLIYLIPINYIKQHFKYILLILLLIPLQWGINNNQCILTTISKNLGSLNKNDNKKSAFSEKYLKWLYNPILFLFGQEWTNKNIDIMVYVHWIVNFILLWYYLFFFGKCNLI